MSGRGRTGRLAIAASTWLLCAAAAAGVAHGAAPGEISGDLGRAEQVCGPAAAQYLLRKDAARITAAMLCLVNAERRNAGVPPLREDPRLDRDARAHADDMVDRAYRSDVSPTGSTPLSRALGAGYKPLYLFEWSWFDGGSIDGLPAQAVASWVANRSRGDLFDNRIEDVGLAAGFGQGSGPDTGVADFVGIFATENGLELRRRDPSTGQREKVTRQVVPVVIGQDIDLDVARPDGKPVKGPFRWQVGGWTESLKSTSVVSNYVISDDGPRSFGRPSKLSNPNGTNRRTIHFRFIRAGQFDVSVKTGSGDVKATFEVSRPRVQPSPAPWAICGVAANNTVAERNGTAELQPPSLGMGLNDTCGRRYGITWNWVVQAPGGAAGDLAMVQLITKHVETSGKLGLDECVAEDEYHADASSFYPDLNGNRQVPIGVNGVFQARDAPFIRLRNSLKRYYFGFFARDFLMYRSREPGSIWIPIGEIAWHFDASAATRVFPVHWSARVRAQPKPRYAPTVIAPLPTWTRAWQANPSCG